MKLKLKNRVATLTIGLVFCACQGQDPVKKDATDTAFKEKMDAYIEKVMVTLNIKYGISMAVVKDDKDIYEAYYGSANYEKNIPVTPETSFYIASSTKSFTSLAMLMLAHKGILDLDRSLASYFPEGKFDADLNADKVNLRDLLYHTSGIENNNITFALAYTGIYTQEALRDDLLVNTIPNTRSKYGEFKYSNLGYNIIELVLEKELGKSWKQVVQEQVLIPLGMNRTTGNISDIEKLNWPYAVPYLEFNKEGDIKPTPLRKTDRIMHAAGGLMSTSRDMLKFLEAELNEGKVDGKQIFPKEVIALSQESQAKQERKFLGLKRFAYGYGWNIATTPLGDTLVHHYGGFSGTAAQVSFMPEHNIGLSIYANEGMAGLLSTFLISSYAFDYYAGREDLEAYYDEKLSEAKGRILDRYKDLSANAAKQAENTWQMELGFRQYAGSYSTGPLGKVEIEYNENNELFVTLGILKAIATPSKIKNGLRVELRPGSGTFLEFKIEDGEVKSFKMDGLRYKKTK